MDNTENYAIRSAVINKAINYIFDHIDEEITVDDVAHYCSYSRYHLTRMFKEQTDEALYQFIKRIRLECKFCPNGTPILKLAVHPF